MFCEPLQAHLCCHCEEFDDEAIIISDKGASSSMTPPRNDTIWVFQRSRTSIVNQLVCYNKSAYGGLFLEISNVYRDDHSVFAFSLNLFAAVFPYKDPFMSGFGIGTPFVLHFHSRKEGDDRCDLMRDSI